MATKQLQDIYLSDYIVTDVDISLSDFNGKTGLSTLAQISANLDFKQDLSPYAKKDDITIGYVSADQKICLSAGDHVTGISVADFMKDRFVTSAWYDLSSKNIIIRFNDGLNDLSVPVSEMIHEYAAGPGLSLNNNEFSLTAAIPSKTTDLINNSGFIVSSDFEWKKNKTTIREMFSDLAEKFGGKLI